MTIVLLLLFIGAVVLIYYLTRIRMKRKLEELREKRETLPSAALEIRNTKRWLTADSPALCYKKIQLVLKNMESTDVFPEPAAHRVSASLPNRFGVLEKTMFYVATFEGRTQITGKAEPRVSPEGTPVDRGIEVLDAFWQEYQDVYFDSVIAGRKDLIGLEGFDEDEGVEIDREGSNQGRDAPVSLSHDDRESLRALNVKQFKDIEEAKLHLEKGSEKECRRKRAVGSDEDTEYDKGKENIKLGLNRTTRSEKRQSVNEYGKEVSASEDAFANDYSEAETGKAEVSEEQSVKPSESTIKIKDLSSLYSGERKFDFLGSSGSGEKKEEIAKKGTEGKERVKKKEGRKEKRVLE